MPAYDVRIRRKLDDLATGLQLLLDKLHSEAPRPKKADWLAGALRRAKPGVAMTTTEHPTIAIDIRALEAAMTATGTAYVNDLAPTCRYRLEIWYVTDRAVFEEQP